MELRCLPTVLIDSNTITQVNGLSNLVTIKGDLKLYSSQLSDISGLSNLTTIEGDLRVGDGSEGTALTNLDALSNVTTLGGLWLLVTISLKISMDYLR